MSHRLHTLLSLTRAVVGWILIAIGIVYIVFFSLATMGLGGIYLELGEDITDHISLSGIVGPFVTGTVLLVVGMTLREGKKHSVLFLRPFNSIANEKAMIAFSRRLGRRFTIVALDDGVITPPKRSFLRVLASIFLFVPIAFVLFVVGALVMPSGDSTLANRIPALLAISVSIALVRLAWRGIKQPQERPIVEHARGLRRTVLKVRALSTWGLRALCPRVILVKTTDEMWQAAVADIGKVTDFAMIDVSRYSDSIDWEVSFLKRVKPTRSLVVASEEVPNVPSQCDFAGAVETYAVSAASDSDFESRVRRRLEAML